MKKNVWISIFSMALVGSLAVVGCDSGGDNQVLGGAGTTTTGGGSGGNGGNGGGGLNAGLNGGGLDGAGNGGGQNGTSGTGTTGGGTGTTGTGTSGGGTTGNNFLNPMADPVSIDSLNNPTQIIRLGNRAFFVQGFALGQANGRLMVANVTTNGNTVTVSEPVAVVAENGSPLTESLSNPFGITTDGTDIFISQGINISPEARILRVSNISSTATPTARFENLTDDNGLILNNPAFLLVANINGGEYVYWTEYGDINTGRVRRTLTNGSGSTETVMNQLQFPAGLATDGSNLVVADSLGGANGQVVRVPLAFTGNTPRTPQSNDATVISPGTQQAVARPFEVQYDGSTGFFWTEGAAIETVNGVAATGQGSGAVRYVANNSSTASLVSNGLTNAAGLSVASVGNGQMGVLFSESIAINGRILRRVVDVNNVTSVAPSVVDIGLNRPLDVAIVSATTPVFAAVVNYNGGQANGLLNGYGPLP